MMNVKWLGSLAFTGVVGGELVSGSIHDSYDHVAEVPVDYSAPAAAPAFFASASSGGDASAGWLASFSSGPAAAALGFIASLST